MFIKRICRLGGGYGGVGVVISIVFPLNTMRDSDHVLLPTPLFIAGKMLQLISGLLLRKQAKPDYLATVGCQVFLFPGPE